MRRSFNRTLALLPVLVISTLASLPAAAQNCEAKLGAIGPMSGGAAAWGLAAKAGAEFAAALANEDGGLQMGNRKCRVKVVTYDAQYTAAGGAAASNFLASENVKVTLGPVGSPETTGFRPVAKRHGQINFSSSYMAGVIGPEFPLSFHALQSPVTWGPLLVKAAADQFKFKSVMVVGANDQGGTDGSKQLIKLYGEAGIKGTEEYYQRGTTNFGPIAARIINAKPEAVDLATMPPQDTTVLVKALMDAGYNGVIGALGGAGAPPVLQGAGGPEKLKGFYWLEVSPLDHPGVVKLKADYQRVMKAAPPDNPLFPVFALAAEVALKGMAAAGTDSDVEKIADALRKSTPESRYLGKAGWRGKSIYGLNQELSFPVGLGLVVDGKKLPVKTINIPSEQ
ncbi:MAG TPA: ABC transporter substrate-binding protein [Ramlibacter sp.]|nr:ABC transporter substrate-binding protein [Ramlibacter sp.]